MSRTAESTPSGPLSRDAYRQWVEAQPHGRFERIDGRVVAMAPERASHADRKAMIWLALRQAIITAQRPCHVYPDGMTIEVEDAGDYEPDAVLHCGEPLPADAVTVPNPLVVVEVLSPRPEGVDSTRKLVGYFTVPSVRHYLIWFADRPQVIHHRRRDNNEGLDTRMLTTGKIVLDPPGIAITVEEVYRT